MAMQLVGVDLDVCPLCNGAWLDKDELFQITRSRGNDALQIRVVNKKVTQFSCPRCGDHLHEGCHSEDIEFLLDECAGCGGMWLDRGELSRLISR